REPGPTAQDTDAPVDVSAEGAIQFPGSNQNGRAGVMNRAYSAGASFGRDLALGDCPKLSDETTPLASHLRRACLGGNSRSLGERAQPGFASSSRGVSLR
ncbi:MAG: hypothetical protein P8Z74_18425, partial [Acidobacteriota bacterium]